MQGTVKKSIYQLLGKVEVFAVITGEYGWRGVGGCIPQVLRRAALLETKCDRNVAVALENKSFGGERGGKLCQTEIIRLETTGPHKSK